MFLYLFSEEIFRKNEGAYTIGWFDRLKEVILHLRKNSYNDNLSSNKPIGGIQ